MNFFKTFLAALLAIVASFFVLGFLFFVVMAAIISSSGQQEQVVVKENTFLHLKLNYPIVENAVPDAVDFDLGKFLPLPVAGSASKAGMYQIVNSIKHAAENDNITGMYINLSGGVATGWANLSTIRKALIDFKETGKPIYAYSELYSENSYYLASVADSIFMPAEGMMEMNGFSASPMFYKGLFDKLDIRPKVFKVGTFKSAVEPWIRKDMSEESRAQTEQYIKQFWNIFAREVAASRGLGEETINKLANTLILADGKQAKASGLVDAVITSSEMLDKLKALAGSSTRSNPRFISLKKYLLVPQATSSYGKDRIAVIVAEGTMMPGENTDGIMGSSTVVKALRTVRKDKKVKGVILRINSPGGSIIAADLIEEELKLLKKEKPVYASMGNVAASGGYYIAAPCDTIFAQENTVTGSIGIFSILYDGHSFLDKKLGITFDEVATHELSGIGNPGLEWSPAAEAFMQKFTERGYGTFIETVKNGRNFPDSISVDRIAQGRVWTGTDALDKKLVDEIGNLQTAIDAMAERLELEEYAIKILPKAKSPFEEIFEGLNSTSSALPIPEHLTKEWKVIEKLKRTIPASGTYALMPYEVDIK